MTIPRGRLSKFSSALSLLLAVLLAGVIARAAVGPPRPDGETDGYSYLRMEIAGRPVTNIVHVKKYEGWLQIISVRARASQPAATDSDAASKSKWTLLPAIFRSGHASAGKLRFGAGDDGGLDSLVEAKKRGVIIASASFDLYDESSGKFLGKYNLKGLRVLSLEDVQASACAMYSITLSFEFAEKIQS